MSSDAVFVEYALPALLKGTKEVDGLMPIVVFTQNQLKAVLNVERLRPERLSQLRQLCSDAGIGYGTLEGDHIFFLDDLSGRRFDPGEFALFQETMADFAKVYGSERADDMLESGEYRGIHGTVLSAQTKGTPKPARVRRVR